MGLMVLIEDLLLQRLIFGLVNSVDLLSCLIVLPQREAILKTFQSENGQPKEYL